LVKCQNTTCIFLKKVVICPVTEKPTIWLFVLQCVYSKCGHLENTNQSHCRTKIEKINKRRL
jgi:hypothetical protein